MAIDQSVFDKEKFRQWLEDKPSQSIVGVARSCDFCPLAAWLNDQGFISEVISDAAWIRNRWMSNIDKYHCGNAVELPLWAQRFVHDIDVSELRQVMKEAALDVLSKGTD
jgi:hypothetical protein